ncbi:MAG: hypothetical protein U0746_06165 [Gemmataceae bacterium]
MITRRRFLLLALALLGTPQLSRTAEPIKPEQFAKLQAIIKPGQDEDRWATIPWLTDLWQARKLAAREGKPILLWEMDGHPLGCT